MSEKKMRVLRRKVFGDFSQRTRHYMVDEKTRAIKGIGLRGIYQREKKARKERER